MSEDFPLEKKRARRGLGARSAAGESIPARPEGRLTRSPERLHRRENAGTGSPGPHGRPQKARAQQRRRRTLRDNPDRGVST